MQATKAWFIVEISHRLHHCHIVYTYPSAALNTQEAQLLLW